MRKLNYSLIAAVIIFVIILSACNNDSSVNPQEQRKLELIAKMKATTDSLFNNGLIPGIAALVVDRKNDINWFYSTGFSNVEKGDKMNKDLLFRIGSNTKTLTITVLLQLMEEGKLSLDDKLSKYFPDLPKADTVTIRMLCNMTSGYYNYTDTPEFIETLENESKKVWQPQELIDIAFRYDPYFEPGADFHYSNTNTIIVGLIIEKITGNTLEQEVKNRIINPLDLKNTNLDTKGTSMPPNHCKGYFTEAPNKFIEITEYYDVSWAWAAGSSYSTIDELKKYVEAFVGGGLLNSETQNKRLNEDFRTIKPNVSYGLGILKRGSFYGHNGGLPGFASSMYYSLEKDCAIIIYFNSFMNDLHSDYLFYRFTDILYGYNY